MSQSNNNNNNNNNMSQEEDPNMQSIMNMLGNAQLQSQGGSQQQQSGFQDNQFLHSDTKQYMYSQLDFAPLGNNPQVGNELNILDDSGFGGPAGGNNEDMYADFNPVMDVLKQLEDDTENSLNFNMPDQGQGLDLYQGFPATASQIQQPQLPLTSNVEQFFNPQGQQQQGRPQQQQGRPQQQQQQQQGRPQQQQQGRPQQQQQQIRPKAATPALKKWVLPLPKKKFSCMQKYDIVSVLRTQLNQLSTVDPAKDDFYNQVYRTRSQRNAKNKKHAELFPVAHRVVTIYQNADGTPKMPEGTLGKISGTSLRRPRKMLDFSSKSKNSSAQDTSLEPAEEFMFGGYSLSFLIEEGLKFLMALEDIDSFLITLEHSANNALDPHQRQRDINEINRLRYDREQNVHQLAGCLDLTLQNPPPPSPDHILLNFAQVAKGRLLIFRSLLLMGYESPYRFEIIRLLLCQPDCFIRGLKTQVVEAKKGQTDPHALADDKLASVVCDHLFQMPMHFLLQSFYDFVHNVNASQTYTMTDVCKVKMGCVLLQVFTKKGFQIQSAVQKLQNGFQFPPNVNPTQDLNNWRQVHQYFVAQILGSLPDLLVGLPRQYKHADKHSAVTLVQAMWELLASCIAHMSPEQTTQLKADLGSEFAQEVTYRKELANKLKKLQEAKQKKADAAAKKLAAEEAKKPKPVAPAGAWGNKNHSFSGNSNNNNKQGDTANVLRDMAGGKNARKNSGRGNNNNNNNSNNSRKKPTASSGFQGVQYSLDSPALQKLDQLFQVIYATPAAAPAAQE